MPANAEIRAASVPAFAGMTVQGKTGWAGMRVVGRRRMMATLPHAPNSPAARRAANAAIIVASSRQQRALDSIACRIVK